jgi:hypothetical protein
MAAKGKFAQKDKKAKLLPSSCKAVDSSYLLASPAF